MVNEPSVFEPLKFYYKLKETSLAAPVTVDFFIFGPNYPLQRQHIQAGLKAYNLNSLK